MAAADEGFLARDLAGSGVRRRCDPRAAGSGGGQQGGGKGQYAQCVDGEDNDEDGYIDDTDPSCAGLQDDDEFPVDPPTVEQTQVEDTTQCDDTVDNDGDGFVDLDDPSCDDDPPDDDESPPDYSWHEGMGQCIESPH